MSEPKPTNQMCQSCNTNPAKEEHACPYRAEIDDDGETLCNCCDACADDCAGSI